MEITFLAHKSRMCEMSGLTLAVLIHIRAAQLDVLMGYFNFTVQPL